MSGDYSFTQFGRDPHSYNANENEEEDGSGNVGIILFSRALQVWSVCQAQPVSVADAAKAFRVPPRLIVDAVNDHCWMFLCGPNDDYTKLLIEHEGE